MRENKEYKNDFKKVLKLREKTTLKQKYEYYSSPEGQKEKEYCEKWDLGIPFMLDPSLSFEELFENELGFPQKNYDSELQKWAMNLLERWQAESALKSEAVEILRTYYHDGKVALDREIKPGDFLIRIDFSKVNSLKTLKAVVSELLEKRYNFEALEILEIKEKEFMGEKAQQISFKRKNKTNRPKSYKIDYDIYLKVGRMKEYQGMTNEQIAKKIFPRDFQIDNENAKPESKIRQISNFYKKYKELVNGGYKKITYP
jgi:hypothetical protein